MNQSIDKLANLLLARKAIHSLPANTTLTLRELNALMLECQGNATAAMATAKSTSMSSSPTPSSSVPHAFSGIRSNDEGAYQRHPHQAPLSVMASSMEASPGARFRVTVRQLSSTSSGKQ